MGNDKIYLLAGDIGGTKTNLGLYTAGPHGPVNVARETYASQDVESLEAMIERLLQLHPATVTAASFGIAGPVIGGAARLTNLSWDVSVDRLQKRFNWKRVHLINDLTATALAVNWLGPEDLYPLNRVPGDKTGAIAVVAPGTGLGVALRMRDGGRWLNMASEGGHADFAPTDEDEIRLWRYLHQRYGHVSMERVLSGRGLIGIYEWICAERPADDTVPVHGTAEGGESADPARIITQHALEGSDELCREALLRFCRILGAVAGNVALTGLTTGGVYLGGGIPPKILPALKASDFMNSFSAKGRFSDFLASIPVWVIGNDNAALIGAARRAFELASAENDTADAGQPG
jgi:glucokinase